MMTDIISIFETIIGGGKEDLSVLQILARCIIIYIAAIALVRIGKKRFLGKIAAFDTILAIVLGSLLSRAITEKELFLKILAASLLLILLHRVFSLAAAYSDKFGDLIKGNDRIVLRDGEILWDAMKKSSLSEQDLMQTLRLNAKTMDISRIKIARLERNGDISVIMIGES